MSLKSKLRYAIPKEFLNRILLNFPFFYKISYINYESGLSHNELNDLLLNLEKTLSLKGNIIECGSSLCGTSIVMANYLIQEKSDKIVYACDSFEGFDKNELKREREMNLTNPVDNAFTITSYEYVTKKIEKLGLKNIVIPIKGFFVNTLHRLESDYCFAFIDCDLADSIFYSASAIWPKLSSNGIMVFHDYNNEKWKGATIGIDKFVNSYEDKIKDYGITNYGLFYVIKK
ncbi:MAG: class I SAM-dependent methyltransferase [Candidatus Methanofastidiosum sp.]|nr:class I SAM-dependent methyltransferase [Methanofastidiosum sp.]